MLIRSGSKAERRTTETTRQESGAKRIGRRSSIESTDRWGRSWRSGFEARIANSLPTAAHAEPEPCGLPYTLHCVYTPDIRLPNGVFVEIKGELTEEDRRKLIAVKAQHPGIDIRIVLQEPNRLLRRCRHLSQSGWCQKNGFPWARDGIPRRWYDDR